MGGNRTLCERFAHRWKAHSVVRWNAAEPSSEYRTQINPRFSTHSHSIVAGGFELMS
jgi:hypothetical protein